MSDGIAASTGCGISWADNPWYRVHFQFAGAVHSATALPSAPSAGDSHVAAQVAAAGLPDDRNMANAGAAALFLTRSI